MSEVTVPEFGAKPTTKNGWIASLRILRARQEELDAMAESRAAALHIAVDRAVDAGMTGPEIAAALGITKARVYQMRKHGRELLGKPPIDARKTPVKN